MSSLFLLIAIFLHFYISCFDCKFSLKGDDCPKVISVNDVNLNFTQKCEDKGYKTIYNLSGFSCQPGDKVYTIIYENGNNDGDSGFCGYLQFAGYTFSTKNYQERWNYATNGICSNCTYSTILNDIDVTFFCQHNPNYNISKFNTTFSFYIPYFSNCRSDAFTLSNDIIDNTGSIDLSNYVTPEIENAITNNRLFYRIIEYNSSEIEIKLKNNSDILVNYKYNLDNIINYKLKKNGTTTITFQGVSLEYSEHTPLEDTSKSNCSITFKHCYPSCLECELSTQKKEISDNYHGCSKCKEGYYFNETQDDSCFHYENNTVEGYYLDNDTYRKCNESCKFCFNKGNETYSNCSQCKNGLYFIETEPTNCYKFNSTPEGFYLDGDTFRKCNSTCKFCNGAGNSTYANCSICKNDYHFIFNESTNCIHFQEQPEGLYLDNESNMYKECNSTCKFCNGAGNSTFANCSICKNDYHFIFNESTNCIQFKDQPEGLYLDNETNMYKECYSSCKFCSGSGTSKYANCSSCKNDYHFIYNESTNCIQYKQEPEGLFLNKTIDTYEPCNKVCLTCHSYGENEYQNCDKCNETAGYFFNASAEQNSCIANISQYYYLDLINVPHSYRKCYNLCNKCNSSGTEYKNNCSECLPDYEITTLQNKEGDCKPLKQLNPTLDNITLFFPSNNIKNTKIIQSPNSVIYFYNYNGPNKVSNDLSESMMPKINISECEQVILAENNSEEFIIGEIYIPTQNETTNKILFNIYNSEGQTLNLTKCDSLNFSTILPYNNDYKSTLLTQLVSDDISIYHSESDLFNNYCSSYSLNKKDISINKIRSEYISLCDNNCQLFKIDSANKLVYCQCNGKISTISNSTKKSDVNFIPINGDVNLKIIGCLKLFNHPNAWIQTLITFNIIFQFLCVFLFLFHQEKNISLAFNIRIKAVTNPPKRQSTLINNSDSINDLLDTECISEPDNTPTPTEKNNSRKKSKIFITKMIRSFYDDYCTDEKNESTKAVSQAKDKRSLSKIIIDIALDKLLFISLFFGSSIYKPFSIKAFFLFSDITIYFLFNCLFFKEQYIIDRYNYEGDGNSFLYNFTHDILKLFLSILVGYCLNRIIHFFIYSTNLFTNLYKRNQVSSKITKNLTIMLTKLGIISILVIFVEILCWCYLCAFGQIYQYTQLSLFFSVIICLIWDMLITLSFSIVVGILRKNSLDNSKRLMYLISQFLFRLL